METCSDWGRHPNKDPAAVRRQRGGGGKSGRQRSPPRDPDLAPTVAPPPPGRRPCGNGGSSAAGARADLRGPLAGPSPCPPQAVRRAPRRQGRDAGSPTALPPSPRLPGPGPLTCHRSANGEGTVATPPKASPTLGSIGDLNRSVSSKRNHTPRPNGELNMDRHSSQPG